MGAYVDIGPVSVFYEAYGDEGEPVVLLHGALGAGYMLAEQSQWLSSSHRVLVPDMRGRGYTADVPGPLTFTAMVEDVVGFIDEVLGEPAHLVGASDGGIIGLGVALTSPGSLRSLVAIGANYHFEGVLPEAGLDTPPDDDSLEMVRGRYAAMSPDGADHWPVIHEKVMTNARSRPTWTSEDLATIVTPTLVVAGDDDLIALEHTISMYRSIPEARLAVIPGASHACFVERPVLVNQIIEDFMTDPDTPSTLVPVRRANVLEA